MKKIIAIAVSVMMIFVSSVCTVFGADATITFTDVDANTTQGAAIYKLVKAGVVNGRGDGTFGPDLGITRAELCKMINVAYKYSEADTEIFADVNPSAWYASHVHIAKKAGYIKGTGNGKFEPLRNITKQEFCVILCRIMSLYNLSEMGIKVDIKDEIASWAQKDVYTVVSNSIMTTDKDGNFKATMPITRGEVAVVLANFVNVDTTSPSIGNGSTSNKPNIGGNSSGNGGSGNGGSGNGGSGNGGSGNSGGNTGSDNTGSGNTGSDNTGSGNTGSDNTGSGNTGSGNTGSDNSGSDNTGSGNTGSGNTGSGNTGSDNSGSGNTGSGNTGSGNTGSDNTGSGNTGSDNTGSGNTGSDNTGSGNTGSDNTGSDNTGSGNTGSGNTGSGNTGSDNTGSGNTGSGNTGSDNTGSGNTGSDNTGSGNTGSDNTGSDNTGSGNTGSDNTGSDNTGGNTGNEDIGGDDNVDDEDTEPELTPNQIKKENSEVITKLKSARISLNANKNMYPGQQRLVINNILKVLDKVIADESSYIINTGNVFAEYQDDILYTYDIFDAWDDNTKNNFKMNIASIDPDTFDFLADFFGYEF